MTESRRTTFVVRAEFIDYSGRRPRMEYSKALVMAECAVCHVGKAVSPGAFIYGQTYTQDFFDIEPVYFL